MRQLSQLFDDLDYSESLQYPPIYLLLKVIAANLCARCVQAAADEINGYESGEAVAFAVKQYNKAEVSRIFEEIKVKWPGAVIRDAINNIAHRISRPFLQLTQQITGKCSAAPGAVASLSGLPFALG
ncbi:uncharacterized protein EI90DRAFT_3010973 [Cantharellus anzutake]|uniref:uncharacterized protein n=1 Tax=Cantharellus anzutake TaxID=1750568 RepID=UPI001907C9F2|nr:uncharacterized protein EI90DRAFT_3010973 [Cantharellus anzutake]KAF8344187.1 hypothetical protein EI90DRAFT_3010973 [Cantharellus anzutake]